MAKQRKGKGTVKTEQANRQSDKKALDAVSRTVIAGMREGTKKFAAANQEGEEKATKKRPGRHARAGRAKQNAASVKTAQETTVEPVLDTTSKALNHGEKDMPTPTTPAGAGKTTAASMPTTVARDASAPIATPAATGSGQGEAASVSSVSSSLPSTSTTQVTPTTTTPYIRPRWMERRKPILSYSLNDDPTKREATFLLDSIKEGYSRQILELDKELNDMLQKEGKQFRDDSSIPSDPKQKAAYVQKRLEFAKKYEEFERLKNLVRKGRESGGEYNNAKLDLLRWKMEVIDPTKNQQKYAAAKKEYENFALQVSNSRLQKHLKKLLILCNLRDDQKTPEMEKEAQFLLTKVKEDITLFNKVCNAKRGVGITDSSSTDILNNQGLKIALEKQSALLADLALRKPEEFLPAKPERASSNVSNEPTPYEQFVAAKVEEEVKAEMAKRNEKWDEKSSEEQYQIMKEAIRRRSKQQDMIEAFAKGGAKVQGAITKPGVCEYKVTGGKIVEKDGKNGVSYEIEGNVNSTIKVPRRNKDGSISTTSFDVLEIVNGEPHLHLSDDLTTTCRLDVKEMGKYIENQRNAKPVVIDHGQEVQVKSVGAISPSATPKASQGAAQGAARGT